MFTHLNKGLLFPYYGDTIYWLWPWKRDVDKFFSTKYNTTFYSMNEYWKYIGSLGSSIKMGNILGITTSNLVSEWISIKFPKEVVIALTDINIDRKPQEFWEKIPSSSRNAFVNEVVILRCKDVTQAKQITDSININFAEVNVYKNSILIYDNKGY